MKYLILILVLFCSFSPFGKDFYSITINTIDGVSIPLKGLKGKLVVIGSFHAGESSLKELNWLDSFQKTNPAVAVIAVPSLDAGAKGLDPSFTTAKASLSRSLMVTEPALVKKGNSGKQMDLFRWLTDAAENTHFDVDWESEQQVFVINGQGTLYAVLREGFPPDVLQKVLRNPVTE